MNLEDKKSIWFYVKDDKVNGFGGGSDAYLAYNKAKEYCEPDETMFCLDDIQSNMLNNTIDLYFNTVVFTFKNLK